MPAKTTLKGTLTIAPSTVVREGLGAERSRIGVFSLGETINAVFSQGGGLQISGTTTVPMHSITTIKTLYIKNQAAASSLTLNLTSSVGANQHFLLSGRGQFYLSGTALTSINITGTGSVIYEISGD